MSVTPAMLKSFLRQGGGQKIKTFIFGTRPGLTLAVFMQEPGVQCNA